MSLFGNLKTDGLEESTDQLGGGMFEPHAADIYTGTIKMAYAGKSQGGAQSVTLLLDFAGREYRETLWVTNKQGQNSYAVKDKDGNPTEKRKAMMGFTVMDEICLVTTDKPLCEQDFEDKMVKVYDADQKKELPKSVPVLVELLGKTVSLGVLNILENKSKKEGDKYVPLADTRVTNAIDKVFHTETQMTVVEIRNKVEAPAFWNAWLERNKGQQRDKRTIKDGATAAQGQSGRPGAASAGGPPQAGGQAGAPRKSLFGNKAA